MEGSPLYALLNEINIAAKNGLAMLAISMTVALPDICASLASKNGQTTGPLYKKWCEKNLPPDQFSFVTPADLWSMRCGVLHNGRFGDMKHSVARVVFALPGPGTLSDCKMNDTYIYSVVTFCTNFTTAVYTWMEANRSDPTIQANIERLMQYYPNGLAPYIVGMRLLA